jgi:hypothetical protein
MLLVLRSLWEVVVPPPAPQAVFVGRPSFVQIFHIGSHWEADFGAGPIKTMNPQHLMAMADRMGVPWDCEN